MAYIYDVRAVQDHDKQVGRCFAQFAKATAPRRKKPANGKKPRAKRPPR